MFEHRFSMGMVLILIAGCSAQPRMDTPVDRLERGQYGRVRVRLYQDMTRDRADRDYILDRSRLGVITLADGYAAAARTILLDVYDALREQGVNRARDAQTALLNEDVRTWKGEPYEQALAMLYVALSAAQLGEWDNARAALANARTLMQELAGEPLPDEATLAQRSRIYERAIAEGATESEARRRAEQVVAPAYTHESNFTLACLLGAVAAQQLGLDDEAADYFTRTAQLNDPLSPIIERLRRGDYNALLIVSYGLAPSKELLGDDESTVRWQARTASDARPLAVRLDDEPWGRHPVAEDVNHLASFYTWDQFAKLRGGKSTVGDVLIVGGAGATVIGADHRSAEAVGAGLGAIAAGLFLKAGAHGDASYNDLLPQRYYVVPLSIDAPQQRITLKLGEARLTLTGLEPPSSDGVALRYVRLPPRPGRWAHSGRRYPFDPPSGAPTRIEDTGGFAGLHLLEGGRSAIAPDSATVGDARLFGLPRQIRNKETDP